MNYDGLRIRHVRADDKSFWFSLDKHLPLSEFKNKVTLKQGYVLTADDRPAGILRYNLFWDNTPFCTLLYIDSGYRRSGYGSKLMLFWESEMKRLGYNRLLVSTQADESAQHFYRALGYSDCGCLIVPDQPAEIFLSKEI